VSDLQYFQNIPIERLREQVIDQLKGNYAHDNIGIEDFERRLEIAASSEDRFELLKVVQGLPALRGSDLDQNYAKSRQNGEAGINLGQVRNEESIVAVFSGVDRKSVWRPARKTKLLALFGGMDLDFSRAYMPPGDSHIDAMCVFGGVDLLVPEGLNVEVHGFPLFGGIDNRTSGEYLPGAPTLHIRAFVLFGGMEIKHKKKRRGK